MRKKRKKYLVVGPHGRLKKRQRVHPLNGHLPLPLPQNPHRHRLHMDYRQGDYLLVLSRKLRCLRRAQYKDLLRSSTCRFLPSHQPQLRPPAPQHPQRIPQQAPPTQALSPPPVQHSQQGPPSHHQQRPTTPQPPLPPHHTQQGLPHSHFQQGQAPPGQPQSPVRASPSGPQETPPPGQPVQIVHQQTSGGSSPETPTSLPPGQMPPLTQSYRFPAPGPPIQIMPGMPPGPPGTPTQSIAQTSMPLQISMTSPQQHGIPSIFTPPPSAMGLLQPSVQPSSPQHRIPSRGPPPTPGCATLWSTVGSF